MAVEAPDTREHRRGMLAGVGAYTLWGLFPLVFRPLGAVSPFEILLNRIVWSLVVVLAVLAWQRRWAWARALLGDRRQLARLASAGVLVATNWVIYIWAVDNDHVVEAALGYYVNPLITVALGVAVLREKLRPLQAVALGFGAASVAVLTAGYGRLPWIAVALACTFAAYGFQKQGVTVGAVPSLAVETAVLAPLAVAAMALLQVSGRAALGQGPPWQDALLVSLGVVTAVPLLLFATAATRIPLSMLGLLQYLTPTGQLVIGVFVFDEPLPPERLAGFVLVWIALVVLGIDAVRASRAGRRPVPLPLPEPG